MIEKRVLEMHQKRSKYIKTRSDLWPFLTLEWWEFPSGRGVSLMLKLQI